MSRGMSKARERELRKELLRARAAVERQDVRRHACGVAQDLSPSALVRSVVPKSLSSGQVGSVLWEGAGLLGRYPFLVSSLSGLLSGRGRLGRRLLRMTLGAATAWQVLRVVKSRSASHNTAATRTGAQRRSGS